MHPILFKIHGITLYSYGLSVALAMMLTLYLASRRSAKAGIRYSDAVDLLFVIFISGMAGARLFYVLQHWDSFRTDPVAAFRFTEGGLVWYGGFLSSVFSGVVFCRYKKEPVLRWADFFAPLLAFAHALGRVGCFLNGCCYGARVDSFLGVRFPDETFGRHPVQIYESLALAGLGAALLILSAKKRHPGEISAFYLLGYGFLRFVLEFLRGDQDLYFYLTIPQWISVSLVIFSILFLKYVRASHDHTR